MGDGLGRVADPMEVAEVDWEEVAARLAETKGVPAEALLLSTVFTNSTYERVGAILDRAREANPGPVLVVSDPLHGRRIDVSAAKQNAGDMVITTVATPNEYYLEPYQYHPDRWWQDEYFLKEATGEYVKLLYYAIKY